MGRGTRPGREDREKVALRDDKSAHGSKGLRERDRKLDLLRVLLDNARLFGPAKPEAMRWCCWCHPADPPLEPQDGRLPNLFRTTRMSRGDA